MSMQLNYFAPRIFNAEDVYTRGKAAVKTVNRSLFRPGGNKNRKGMASAKPQKSQYINQNAGASANWPNSSSTHK